MNINTGHLIGVLTKGDIIVAQKNFATGKEMNDAGYHEIPEHLLPEILNEVGELPVAGEESNLKVNLKSDSNISRWAKRKNSVRGCHDTHSEKNKKSRTLRHKKIKRENRQGKR